MKRFGHEAGFNPASCVPAGDCGGHVSSGSVCSQPQQQEAEPGAEAGGQQPGGGGGGVRYSSVLPPGPLLLVSCSTFTLHSLDVFPKHASEQFHQPTNSSPTRQTNVWISNFLQCPVRVRSVRLSFAGRRSEVQLRSLPGNQPERPTLGWHGQLRSGLLGVVSSPGN